MVDKNKDGDVTGMLSDTDIERYFGNGIDIYVNEVGQPEFKLKEQLRFGSIDLRFHPVYRTFKTKDQNGNKIILNYDMIKGD